MTLRVSDLHSESDLDSNSQLMRYFQGERVFFCISKPSMIENEEEEKEDGRLQLTLQRDV